jgi:hypothetical protein
MKWPTLKCPFSILHYIGPPLLRRSQGDMVVVGTIVLWFPVYVMWDFIFVRIVPPRFEAYIP